MKVIISQEIIKKYPKTNIGVLIAKDIKVREYESRVEEIKREVERLIRERYTLDMISLLPQIQVWRKIYRSFGAKPSKFRCSVEALVRRVLKGEKLPQINTLTDLYNSISIKYLLPIGGYDLEKIEGDIFLRFSQIGETFLPLGGHEVEFLPEGEVIYADLNKVICRKWNYRDCDQTKITLQTKNAILFIDGGEGIEIKIIEKALDELERYILLICGGKTKKVILSKENPIWTI